MTSGLVDASESLLLVVDVQAAFVKKLDPADGAALVARIGWLIRVATRLAIPVVASAEDVVRNGSLVDELLRVLPQPENVHDKLVFDLTADPGILAAVGATDRSTAVLVGLETDVCIAQSAIGLLANGYRAVVVADGTGSPGHNAGLARIERAGAEVVSMRELYYEWLRTVSAAAGMRKELAPDDVPPGLVL